MRIRALALHLAVTLAVVAFAIGARAQAPQTDFTFLHITDTHVSGQPHAAALEQFVNHVKTMADKPAFVVTTGDLTELGTEADYGEYTRIMHGLPVPFYATPGNHDVRWAPLGKRAFTDVFEKLYRSFEYGGCHFVLLDSTVLLSHWGHFDGAQIKWLQGDLKRLKKGTPIFVFFHHPVGGDNRFVDNADELLRTLAPYNVIAMLVGHGHSDLRWTTNGIECVEARGLYQGSVDHVHVTADRVEIQREFLDEPGRKMETIASIPRAGTPRRLIAFAWDDPNVPLLERRRFLAELRDASGKARDEKSTASYTVDDDAETPMERDTRDKDSVSFVAQFPTKKLSPGSHRICITVKGGDGVAFQRDEWFTVERLGNEPRSVWDQPFATGNTIQSSAVLVGQTLYATSFDKNIYALDARNGRRRWSTATKGAIYSSPCVSGDNLYVGSMDGTFYALDARSGHTLWTYKTDSPIFATAATAKDTVCFAGNKHIYGLDARTGKEQWTVPAGSFFQSRAATDGTSFYIGGWDNTLYAIDAESGSVRWQVKMGRANSGHGALSFYYAPAIAWPCVSDGRVFAATNDSTLHCLDAATGNELWTARHPQGGDKIGYSSPLAVGNRVFIGALGPNGDVYAFDTATGKPIWRAQTGGENYESSLAMQGNTLAIGSVQGRLFWIDAETGKVTTSYSLDRGFTFTNPVLAPGRLFMTSMNGQVYALQTR